MSASGSAHANSRLRQERIGRNWRQHDVAEHLGTTVVTVNRWERGEQQPSAYFRVKLCALFGKNAEELGLLPEVSPPQAPVQTQSRMTTESASPSHDATDSPMESWSLAGSHPQNYELGIDAITTYWGKNSGYIKSAVAKPEGFGSMRQVFKAGRYRNKRLRFSGMIKSEGVEGWAALWMRINGIKDSLGYGDTKSRPIKGTIDWQRYEIVLDAPEASVAIGFGLALEGKGQVWLSDVHFEEVGMDVPVTGYADDYPDAPANLNFAHQD